ncbi:unnamed protein product [Ectocarpus sp. 12 AP-2014]
MLWSLSSLPYLIFAGDTCMLRRSSSSCAVSVGWFVFVQQPLMFFVWQASRQASTMNGYNVIFASFRVSLPSPCWSPLPVVHEISCSDRRDGRLPADQGAENCETFLAWWVTY